MKRKTKKHGGARPGSGRKKKEPTKTIRVPVSIIDVVKLMAKRKRKGQTA